MQLEGRGKSLYLLAGLSLALQPWNERAFVALGLTRAGLGEGEVWRIWTGPLVHDSWLHLSANVAALVLLQQLFGREFSRRDGWIAAGAVAAAIALAWWAFGDYSELLGLSGVLHGLFVFAAISAFSREKSTATVVLAAVGVKLLFEATGFSGFPAAVRYVPVATDAHFYGVAAGLGTAVILLAWRARPRNRRSARGRV